MDVQPHPADATAVPPTATTATATTATATTPAAATGTTTAATPPRPASALTAPRDRLGAEVRESAVLLVFSVALTAGVAFGAQALLAFVG